MCDSRKKPLPGAWMEEHERVAKMGHKSSAGESVRCPFLYSFAGGGAVLGFRILPFKHVTFCRVMIFVL